MSRPNLVRLFFSAEGRIGRATLWAAGGLSLGLLAAFEYGWPGPMRGWAAGPVKLTLFVAGACLLAKRLHDRGRAGWWSAFPLLALIFAWPRPAGWGGWLATAVLLIAAVDLLLGPGEPRFNRFGPPPD